jgi:hypothetical protein
MINSSVLAINELRGNFSSETKIFLEFILFGPYTFLLSWMLG